MAMIKIRERYNKILLLTVLTLITGFVNAYVFTYYPLTTYISPTIPPVIFKYGSGTGKRDLRETIITVSIGSANTSISITLHPTYQKTYYKDIARINNTDSNAYYIMIDVTRPLTNSKITSAKMYFYEGNIMKLEVNLLTTGRTGYVQINGKAEWIINVEIEISETDGSYNNPPFTSDSATLKLIYSTQNIETPP